MCIQKACYRLTWTSSERSTFERSGGTCGRSALRLSTFASRLHQHPSHKSAPFLFNMATVPQVYRFNVGGKRYEVSESLLDQHPHTMLARLASETRNQGKAEEIFIERDGERFRFVLDFLRDGKVGLPLSADTKATFVAELDYFGVDYGDASSIQHLTDECPRLVSLTMHVLDEMRARIQKSVDAAREDKAASDAALDAMYFVKCCFERHVSKTPVKCQASHTYICNLTHEQASATLAPFGFRCVSIWKNHDYTAFSALEIAALDVP